VFKLRWGRAWVPTRRWPGARSSRSCLLRCIAVHLLSKGVPVSEVAAILGNSPRIVEKHYSQWIQARQDAIEKAIKAAWS
jgi:hypothetical protein